MSLLFAWEIKKKPISPEDNKIICFGAKWLHAGYYDGYYYSYYDGYYSGYYDGYYMMVMVYGELISRGQYTS